MTLAQYISIEEFGIDTVSTCLSESKFNKKSEYLIESNIGFDFDKRVESEKEIPEKDYIIQTVSIKGLKGNRIEYQECVTLKNKYYIGDLKTTKFLIDKKELTKLQPAHPKKYNVCNIGFNEKEQKWYGYSHRAICGFGIGDKIFEENYGNDNTKYSEHGKETIKDLSQAKQSAKNFAEYVS